MEDNNDYLMALRSQFEALCSKKEGLDELTKRRFATKCSYINRADEPKTIKHSLRSKKSIKQNLIRSDNNKHIPMEAASKQTINKNNRK